MDIVTIGWPMATPRLDRVRDLVWKNPEYCRFSAIVFEKRLVASLHSIPIVELAEVTPEYCAAHKQFTVLSINGALIDKCKRHLEGLGISVTNFADLARKLVALNATASALRSPFSEISIGDIRELSSAPGRSRPTQLAGVQSFEVYRSLDAAWRNYAWDGFYDWTSDSSPNTPAKSCINDAFRRGIRNFVVGNRNATDSIDLLIHYGALHRTADYFVVAPGYQVNGARALLHRAVLGKRLGESSESSHGAVFVVADCPSEFIDLLRLSPKQATFVGALVRLPRSLLDLHELAAHIERQFPTHRMEIEMTSADPSALYAKIYC